MVTFNGNYSEAIIFLFSKKKCIKLFWEENISCSNIFTYKSKKTDIQINMGNQIVETGLATLEGKGINVSPPLSLFAE